MWLTGVTLALPKHGGCSAAYLSVNMSMARLAGTHYEPSSWATLCDAENWPLNSVVAPLAASSFFADTEKMMWLILNKMLEGFEIAARKP